MFVGLNFMTMMNASSQMDTVQLDEGPSRKDSIESSFPFLSDTVKLTEAKILPYKNYASFKQAFINLEPVTGQVDGSLIINQQLINKQLDMGITPEMDAQSNYTTRYVQNLIRPQGFLFFSNEPGKGLSAVIPMIRKITGNEKK